LRKIGKIEFINTFLSHLITLPTMKKYLYAVLLFSSLNYWGFTANSFAQTRTKKDRELIQKRRIKSVQLWQYEVVEGEMSKRGALIRMVQYSADGKNSDHKEYNANGSLYLLHEYRYDARGNMIEDIQKDKERRLKFKATFTNDANGNIIEENLFDAKNQLISKTNYTYDSDGKLTEKVEYNGAGEKNYRWEYSFDENGNNNLMRHYNATGKVLFKWVYEFDKKGQLTEATAYNSDDSFHARRTYVHSDESGKLIEETEYNPDNRPKNKFRYSYETFDGRNN